jgi:hypothetical protein
VRFLVRILNRAKWNPQPGLDSTEIPADAVTVDLRTRGNRLSFWAYVGDQDSGIRDAALAHASTRDSVEKLDLVWLPETAFSQDEISFENSPGNTPVAAMRTKHMDAVSLDLVRLGTVARRVAEAIAAKRYKRMTRKDVLKVLGGAVGENVLNLDDVSTKVRVEVERYLQSVA